MLALIIDLARAFREEKEEKGKRYKSNANVTGIRQDTDSANILKQSNMAQYVFNSF